MIIFEPESSFRYHLGRADNLISIDIKENVWFKKFAML